MPLGGAVIFMLLLPAVNPSSIALCPMFTECVTEDGFISITFAILEALGVVTWKPAPYPTAAGAVVIVGREPLNR